MDDIEANVIYTPVYILIKGSYAHWVGAGQPLGAVGALCSWAQWLGTHAKIDDKVEYAQGLEKRDMMAFSTLM